MPRLLTRRILLFTIAVLLGILIGEVIMLTIDHITPRPYRCYSCKFIG